jgi:hypothetical protein
MEEVASACALPLSKTISLALVVLEALQDAARVGCTSIEARNPVTNKTLTLTFDPPVLKEKQI